MRVFSVESDGGFTEYERLPFKMEHEESVLEKWLESNPDGILEDGRVLIIGRQVGTDLGGFIDLCLLFIHPRAPNLINLRSAGTMPA